MGMRAVSFLADSLRLPNLGALREIARFSPANRAREPVLILGMFRLPFAIPRRRAPRL